MNLYVHITITKKLLCEMLKKITVKFFCFAGVWLHLVRMSRSTTGVAFYLLTSLLTRTLAETAEITSTPSLFQRLCASNDCRNGECYLVNTQIKCVCDSVFKGDRCQFVNLDQVHYALIGSVVIFQWPRPPRLKGYSFVYYEPADPNLILYKRSIIIHDNENSVLVGNLKGRKTHYRICIEDEYIAEKALASNAVELLSNCIDLTTQPDYHTMVGWVLLFLLAGCAILLMYSQRQKIEILYFSRPYVPQMEPANDTSSQSQSRSQSQSSLSKQNIPNSIEREA